MDGVPLTVSAHSNVREDNTKSEESRRENRGGQKNYVNKRCMGNKRNYIQNHHGRFQKEFQRTGTSETLNWRSRPREEVFCGREGVPCNSMGHTEAQQISLRKNFYVGNGSLRTAISQNRKDTERTSDAVESDDAELQPPH